MLVFCSASSLLQCFAGACKAAPEIYGARKTTTRAIKIAPPRYWPRPPLLLPGDGDGDVGGALHVLHPKGPAMPLISIGCL